MRLGGPVFEKYQDPDGWVAAVRRLGYTAAFCPVRPDVGSALIGAYAEAARAANLPIAEVGAWSNPLSHDEKVRAEAIEKCQQALALADEIGARCCVNIAGSRGDKWDGPHPENLTEETFDLVVETVRCIIDAVKPKRTCYTLETMPWMYPDSADSYLRLIRAVRRKRFGVHLDPVNLVSSPQRYLNNGAMIRECFRKLGPHIRSCHAKDIILHDRLTVHLDEIRPGMGNLDYPVFVRELSKLEPDTPLMLEHLATPLEYIVAACYIRCVAHREGVRIR